MTPSRRGFCSSTEAGREQRTRCLPRRPSSERDLGSVVSFTAHWPLRSLTASFVRSTWRLPRAIRMRRWPRPWRLRRGEASARGARQEAAMLAEHALRLTPADATRAQRAAARAGWLSGGGG